MKIHFWLHNPRNVSKHPFHFANGIVKNVYPIEIFPNDDNVIILSRGRIARLNLNILAKNDGFNSWDEMKEFFPEDFHGKLILWEDFELTEAGKAFINNN